MLALRELQMRFGAALFEGATEALMPWICSDGIDAESRIEIYRNNLRETFNKTLALEFPVTQRLVGVDYFRQLALYFLADYPSRSGDLHHIGQHFPQFLARWFENTAYVYMSDVASLEWAYQDSLMGADAAPLNTRDLLNVAPEACGELRFTLHPACRLVRSAYPVVRIWRVNQSETPVTDIIDLASGPDRVLVRHVAEGAEFHRLPPGGFALLAALANGATLEEAYDAGCAADPEFNVGTALQRMVALGVLTAAHTPLPRPQQARS
jgi:hypothetical protein